MREDTIDGLLQIIKKTNFPQIEMIKIPKEMQEMLEMSEEKSVRNIKLNDNKLEVIKNQIKNIKCIKCDREAIYINIIDNKMYCWNHTL
jgi:hypothetical protein